jgi:hypothetical protein
VKADDTRTARLQPKAYRPVYYSEYCLACGKHATYLEADHIVELKDGGAPLDPANVLLLCRPCHARKTNQARDERLSIDEDACRRTPVSQPSGHDAPRIHIWGVRALAELARHYRMPLG